MTDAAARGRAPVRVLHLFGQMIRGGAELRTFEVARRCHPGVESHYCVLSGRKGSLDDDVRAAGGHVHYCRMGPLFPFRFVFLLVRWRIDVVHSHVHYPSGMILLLAAIAGVEHRIAHFRATSDGRPQWLGRRLRDRLLRMLISVFSTQILGVSRAALDVAWRKDWTSDARCRVLYNGIVPPQDVTPATAPFRRLHLAGNEKLVVHVGNFWPVKNHVRLAQIFARLARENPLVHLVMIGRRDESILSAIERDAEAAGLQSRIHAVGSSSDVSEWLRASSLMIFPSLNEGLPGAVLEALAHGVPVLASDLPVCREIRGHFPHLRIAGQEWSDAEWAAEARRILDSAPPGSERRRIRAEAFHESPFTIEQAAASMLGVWKGLP